MDYLDLNSPLIRNISLYCLHFFFFLTYGNAANSWKCDLYTPAQRSWWGVYWNHHVCLSVYLSICRWHGFGSTTKVCNGISISNFICMLFVAADRSQFIFLNVIFKMAAWQPHRIFRFPDSNFSLTLKDNSKLHWHITCVYGKKPIYF